MPRIKAASLTDKQYTFLAAKAATCYSKKSIAVPIYFNVGGGSGQLTTSQLARMPPETLRRLRAIDRLENEVKQDIVKINSSAEKRQRVPLAEYQKVQEALLFGTEAQAREAVRKYLATK